MKCGLKEDRTVERRVAVAGQPQVCGVWRARPGRAVLSREEQTEERRGRGERWRAHQLLGQRSTGLRVTVKGRILMLAQARGGQRSQAWRDSSGMFA
jgi:hypothetical protein